MRQRRTLPLTDFDLEAGQGIEMRIRKEADRASPGQRPAPAWVGRGFRALDRMVGHDLGEAIRLAEAAYVRRHGQPPAARKPRAGSPVPEALLPYLPPIRPRPRWLALLYRATRRLTGWTTL